MILRKRGVFGSDDVVTKGKGVPVGKISRAVRLRPAGHDQNAAPPNA